MAEIQNPTAPLTTPGTAGQTDLSFQSPLVSLTVVVADTSFEFEGDDHLIRQIVAIVESVQFTRGDHRATVFYHAFMRDGSGNTATKGFIRFLAIANL